MPGTSFDDVYVVNPSDVRPATPDAVADLESALGTRMPAGYAEYVQRLGEGALGHLVVVHPPATLARHTHDWRERIQQYWFWDTASVGVEPGSIQQHGVAVADTFDGDELCFLPADPDALILLPRDDDVAVRLGPGLIDALEHMLAGDLNPWVEGWTFEASSNDRQMVQREVTSGLDLTAASRGVADLGQHAHVVELGERTTFFLPALGGRLSLCQMEDEPLSLDLSVDPAADPADVTRLLAALGID